jgi:hypothetical protein
MARELDLDLILGGEPAGEGGPCDDLAEIPVAGFGAQPVQMGVYRMRRETEGFGSPAYGTVFHQGTENGDLMIAGYVGRYGVDHTGILVVSGDWAAKPGYG